MTLRLISTLLLLAAGSFRAVGRPSNQVDTVLVFNQTPDTAALVPAPGSPLVLADFLVAGLRSGMDSARVIALLGRPDSIRADDDFRDPGAKLIALVYRDLWVELGTYNSLGAITIVGPSASTTRGLRVGDTQTRVKQLYGTPGDTTGDEWQYELPGSGLTVLAVHFLNGLVDRIYIGHIYD